MADIFDVLADRTRRDILDRLRGGEATVGELVTALGVTQPTVSKHLAQLRDAGLVAAREDGRHRFYAIRTAPLEPVADWVGQFVGEHATTGGTDEAGPTIFAAWAGAEAGGKVGRVAADAAHSARAALEAAQEKLQGAQQRVAEKLPRWSRGD